MTCKWPALFYETGGHSWIVIYIWRAWRFRELRSYDRHRHHFILICLQPPGGEQRPCPYTSIGRVADTGLSLEMRPTSGHVSVLVFHFSGPPLERWQRIIMKRQWQRAMVRAEQLFE